MFPIPDITTKYENLSYYEERSHISFCGENIELYTVLKELFCKSHNGVILDNKYGPLLKVKSNKFLLKLTISDSSLYKLEKKGFKDVINLCTSLSGINVFKFRNEPSYLFIKLKDLYLKNGSKVLQNKPIKNIQLSLL